MESVLDGLLYETALRPEKLPEGVVTGWTTNLDVRQTQRRVPHGGDRVRRPGDLL